MRNVKEKIWNYVDNTIDNADLYGAHPVIAGIIAEAVNLYINRISDSKAKKIFSELENFYGD